MLAAVGQRSALRMQATEFRMEPLANDLALANHNRTHQRIRADPPAPAFRERESTLQMSLIRGGDPGIHSG